jgi:site-specific DNA recombinase
VRPDRTASHVGADTIGTGRTIRGSHSPAATLAHFLRNRFYIGEVVFKGDVFPGEQPAILDKDLFDAVQAKVNDQRNNHAAARTKSGSLLIGRLYDDRGNRMSPSARGCAGCGREPRSGATAPGSRPGSPGWKKAR